MVGFMLARPYPFGLARRGFSQCSPLTRFRDFARARLIFRAVQDPGVDR